MKNYYFLAASLPPLVLGEKIDVSFLEIKERFVLNLPPFDLKVSQLFGLYIDIQNIRSLLQDLPIDNRGNLTEKELDEALLGHFALPQYVFDFLNYYESVSDRLAYFSQLLARFFSEEEGHHRGFLRKYLAFEKQWRLILLGLRAKAMGRDLVEELQFEDPTEPSVAHILAQKDMPAYEPPKEYGALKALFLEHKGDPGQQFLTFTRWRLEQIEDLALEPLFSLDWILSYTARLLVVEDFNNLQEESGRYILETVK